MKSKQQKIRLLSPMFAATVESKDGGESEGGTDWEAYVLPVGAARALDGNE